MVDAAEELSGGQNVISNAQSAENSAGGSLAETVTVSIKLVALTRWKYGTRWTEKIQSEYRTSSVTGHVTTREQAGRT